MNRHQFDQPDPEFLRVEGGVVVEHVHGGDNLNLYHGRQPGHSVDQSQSLPSQVAIVCIQCGAGVVVGQRDNDYHCYACGGEYHFRKCPRCARLVHIHASLYGRKVRCLTCRRTSSWRRWDRNSVRAGAVASQIELPQDEVADPGRRILGGVTIAAAGVPPLAPGIGCKLEFAARHIRVYSLMTTGSYEVVQTVLYESVDFVQISGSGATTITTDAGLIGGGFGVKGAVEGILAASVVNALTRRTTTTIETIVYLKAGPSEVLLNTSTFTPSVLQVLLSPSFARIEQARTGNNPTF